MYKILSLIQQINSKDSLIRRLVLISIVSCLSCISALAQCAGPVQDGNFEASRRGTVSQNKAWTREGSAGIDIDKRLSYRGLNNASVNSTTGWSAIRQRLQLQAGTTYTLRAFIKTSPNITDGYIGFRDASQHPLSEVKFGYSANYRELTVRFKPVRSGRYYIFAGIWGPNQPAWLKVDEVTMTFACEDVHLVPAED